MDNMELWTRATLHDILLGGSNATMDAMSTSSMQSKTQQLIMQLLLNDFQNVRTVHLVLASFSIAASLLVILSVLNDARRASKFEVALRPKYEALSNLTWIVR